MNDHQLDDRLIEAVRDYNAPGAVPREQMWERIRAERAAGRGARGAGRGRIWAGAGIAAAAILAAGIGIGQRMRPAAAGGPPAARVSTISPAPSVDSAKPIVAAALPGGGDSTSRLIGKLREATRGTDRHVRELASAAPSRTQNEHGAGGEPDVGPRPDADNLAYRLVVLQHLAGTEALITSFRTTTKRGEIDAQIAGWSRELLSTTRMLEVSPATTDPVMKRLLEDVDLVIAQILQYAAHGANNPDELDLIEQSINKRSVITKLRSTLPGRTISAGT